MKNKFFVIIKCFAVLLALVFGFRFLNNQARNRKEQIKISSLNISIADSTSNGNLATTEMVRSLLEQKKYNPVGKNLDELDLESIEGIIARHGFVERVNTYANLDGSLNVEVWQRNALARLRNAGRDNYITEDAHIFSAPSSTALYCPVITGDYPLCVPAGFVGGVDEYIDGEIEKLDAQIEEILREKYPIYKDNEILKDERKQLSKRRIVTNAFESEEAFAFQVDTLRKANDKIRAGILYRQRQNDAKMKSIDARVEDLRQKQKKLRKKCEDLYNLIIFVNWVEEDDFWRSEVLQIIADEGDNEALRISLVPRSGRHKIVFGEIESEDEDFLFEEEAVWDELYQVGEAKHETLASTTKRRRENMLNVQRRRRLAYLERCIEEKFDKLSTIYDEGLNRVGWQKYKEINIEFKDQVVCRK